MKLLEKRMRLAVAALTALSTSSPGASPVNADSWYRVEQIDRDTFAISEPRYRQRNVSYLIRGTRAAILYDTGPGLARLQPLVREITALPVLVIPSHFHFDHVGNLGEFDALGVADIPPLRRRASRWHLRLTEDQTLITRRVELRVTRWLRDNSTIDLGGRQVRVFHTPGHTPESISVADIGRQQFFVGDLANAGNVWAFMPGSDLRAIARSTGKLLAHARADARFFDAHSGRTTRRDTIERLRNLVSNVAAGGLTPRRQQCLMRTSTGEYIDGDAGVVVSLYPRVTAHPIDDVSDELENPVEACANRPGGRP